MVSNGLYYSLATIMRLNSEVPERETVGNKTEKNGNTEQPGRNKGTQI